MVRHNFFRIFSVSIWFLASLLFADYSLAQARSPTLERVNFYRDVGRLIRQTRSYITDSSRNAAAKNAVDGLGKEISEYLTWTSDRGALIEVRVEKHPNPDIGIASILGSPVLLGYGDTPTNVLAASTLTERFPSPRDGFIEAPDLSFFIWAEHREYFLGFRSALHYGYIPSEFSEKIRRDALRIRSDQGVIDSIRTVRKAAIRRSAVERLAELADDEAQALRIRNIYDSIASNQEIISSIQNQLNRDLEDLRKANDLYARINQLKAILDVSIFVTEYKASFPEDAEEVENVRDPEVLKEYVEKTRIEKDGYVIEGERQLTLLRDNNQRSSAEIRSELVQKGAPRNVQKEFEQ